MLSTNAMGKVGMWFKVEQKRTSKGQKFVVRCASEIAGKHGDGGAPGAGRRGRAPGGGGARLQSEHDRDRLRRRRRGRVRLRRP